MAVQLLAGHWDLDLETRELLLCPRSRQMFGIEGDYAKKLKKWDWVPRVHPDDMPVIEGELEAAGRRNEIYTARFRVVRPDGSLFRILGVGRTAARDPTRFVGVNFDLLATAGSAEQESPQAGGVIARLVSYFAIRPRPANENESPQSRQRSFLGGRPSWFDKSTENETRHQILLQRALVTMEARQRRHKFLNPAMFGEPAFDMLLALYVTNASPAILSLRILSRAIGVSESCAARWLKLLIDDGLVLSLGNQLGEPGSAHAALTDKGRIALDEYFRTFDEVHQ